MKYPRRAALVLLMAGSLLALGACASAKSSGDQGNTRQDLLTREQIMSVPARNLYEVVQRLRPRWLQVHGGERSFGLSTDVVVYQGQSFLGDVQTLRELSPELAYELRYLDGPTASATLPGIGSRHVAGAIVISAHPK